MTVGGPFQQFWNGHLQRCWRSRWNKDFQVWIGSR